MSNKSPAKVAEGLLLVISAPSGCGKTTLVDRLLKRHQDWTRSISATTREARTGEKNGEDYLFVSRKQFEAMDAEGEFLESARIFESSYGTPKDYVLKQVKEGKLVLMAIDIQGMQKTRKVLPKGVTLLTLFILPPSMKVLRERLEGRKTETSEQIEQRIELAQEEIKAASLYDYTVVNQNLEQTVLEIETIVEKFQTERRKKNYDIHPS